MHKDISGFSLLEILISMVCFSIGMLGLATYESLTIQQMRQIYYQSQASNQAYNCLVNLLYAPTTFKPSIWQTKIAALLPQSQGICALTAGHLQSQLQWRDSQAKADYLNWIV